ncbi:MAG: monovalent cation:proton antiporter-2 (CPA2) family protein [Gammaproteobacteria bacterium]|nr:monovalent cation:proton antiporter-2 (CPA2) family protein [Gammaproteobacteria bacterium]
MTYGILLEVLVLLASAVLVVALFRRLRLPPILAYLAVGMAVGPHGFGWIPDTEDTRLLAEFGVVFLMFTIGLEFSLPHLLAMRRTVLGLGGSQVLITTLLVGLAAWLLGRSPEAAFVTGGALAMSSTAIVTKQLAEQTEIHSRHGRQSIAVLLFQDLAVVPFLILIPALGSGGENDLLALLALTLVKGLAVFALLLAAGRWALRPLFREVATARSPELFMLTVLLVTLGAAWLTHAAGLSLALGAFIAGMMIAETEFRHQVEADIRPFQDVLMGLFFVTVGMLFDLSALPAVWPWMLLLLAVILVFKTGLIMGLARLAGTETGVALRTGVTLAQGGEFSFVIISLALAYGLYQPAESQPLLMAIVLSMGLAPMLIRSSLSIAQRFCAMSYGHGFSRMEDEVRESTHGFQEQVIICGYGRMGQALARFLEQEGREYVALDLDPLRVREARDAGERVHYGDSTRREMLIAAGLMRAGALVVSYADTASAMKILEQVRQLRPGLPVLVRTRDASGLDQLRAMGATEVFPETLESSLLLAGHLLVLLGVPVTRILRQTQAVREAQYQSLRGFFPGLEPVPQANENGARERLHAVSLPAAAHAVDRSLEELDLERSGITVTAVRRGDIRGPQPEPHTRLQEGDVLVLYGTPEALEQAEHLLLTGA